MMSGSRRFVIKTTSGRKPFKSLNYDININLFINQKKEYKTQSK